MITLAGYRKFKTFRGKHYYAIVKEPFEPRRYLHRFHPTALRALEYGKTVVSRFNRLSEVSG